MHARTMGLTVVSVVLLAAGCREAPEEVGPAPEPNTGSAAALAHTEWRLVRLEGEASEPAGKGSAPTLGFDAGQRAGGYGGCNRFGTDYVVDGDTLLFGTIAATKMACPAIGDLERRFFAALEATRAWRLEAERLFLLDADGGVLARFEPAPEGKKQP